MDFPATTGDVLIRGGSVVTATDVREATDVLVRDGKVAAVGAGLEAPDGVPVVDAAGLLVFPGLVDTQVHFREPGLEAKEDLASGALAAVAGGITAFCEMPNTKPPTTSPEALVDKLERAQGRCRADHAFFLGATRENAEQLGDWEQAPGCAGVKVFMGSSTGTLLVEDDDTLERVLRSGSRRVAIHSEDEPRLLQLAQSRPEKVSVLDHPKLRDVETAVRSTKRLLDLVEKTGRKVHILHISTADEIEIVRERGLGELVTLEATPNHLFLCAPECYERWGSMAQMNPPVRGRRHQEAIRAAVADGTISVIGSDHAPHTAEEKARPYPNTPSGIPGVQTSLPLLLTAVRDGWLTLPHIVRLLSSRPRELYGFATKGAFEVGIDGDVVLVDPSITEPLPVSWLRSQTGYSPYEGTELAGWPIATFVRGHLVYANHEEVGDPIGKPIAYA